MKHGLFRELKRRHVYRVAVAYAVVGWLLIQLASTLFPVFGAPAWVLKVVSTVIIIGFPVALVLAWAFEVTPEGVRRTESVDSPEARAPEQHRKIGQTLNTLIIGVLVVAVALLAWRVWAPRKAPAEAAPTAASATHKAAPASSTPAAASSTIPAKSIAVLPFENLSEDKKNGYFADGMQDLILTKLADIGDLKVISRTSTMRYGSHPRNLRQIGQELGVATLLEGSVQKSGNQVLVNVQLINASNDSHIWANSYQRTLENVFGVEGEVAAKIADALKAKLSPAEEQRLTTTLSGNQEANDLYLRAEYYVNKTYGYAGFINLKKAFPWFKKSLAKDPGFALAHARLSMAESLYAFNLGNSDISKLYADALMHAKQALELAPNLAESHLAMGYYEYYGKGDYDAALKAFDAALALRPNDSQAYAARGFVLRRQGRFDDSIDALKRSLVLDPRSLMIAINLGQNYMMARRYEDAIQTEQHALAMDPDSGAANTFYTYSILLQTGDVDRALHALRIDSEYIFSNEVQAVLFSYQGKYDASIALIKNLPDSTGIFYGNGFFISKDLALGDLYRFSGDVTQARVYYAKALPILRSHLATPTFGTAGIPLMWTGIANAQLGLGKTKAGIAAVETALSLASRDKDYFVRPGVLRNAAYAYAHAKDADRAMSLLSRVLSMPGGGGYSPRLLWLDPYWDPIRKSPAFQALLKKYAEYKPATVPGNNAHG